MKKTLCILGAAVTMMTAAPLSISAQEKDSTDVESLSIEKFTGIKTVTSDWEPIGVWPFAYKNFKIAKVQFGRFSKKEALYPCNIHIGRNALWFSQDHETLLEADPANVRMVTFANGDRYAPIGIDDKFGKIIYEGELQGKIARVFMVKKVRKDLVDQRALDYLNKTQNMLQGGSGTFWSHVADSEDLIEPEKRALPIENVFYFFFKGDVFEPTTKNILEHINPARKKEYKAYTRSAEVLSYSERSMMGVWNDFFVNY